MAGKKVILMADGAMKMRKKEPSPEVVNYVKTHGPNEPVVAKVTTTRKMSTDEVKEAAVRKEWAEREGIKEVKTSSYIAKDMSGRVVHSGESISVTKVVKHPTQEEKVKEYVKEHGVESLNKPLTATKTEKIAKKRNFFSEMFHWVKEKPEQAVFAGGTGLLVGSAITRQIGYEIVKAYVQGIVQGGGPDVISTLAQSGAQVPLQVVAAASLYVGSELAITAGMVVAAVGVVGVAGREVWNRVIEPMLNRGDAGKKIEN